MSWQILILISVFFFSLGVILQRVIVKGEKNDPIAFSVIFQLFVGLIIGTWGFVFEDMSLPNLTPLIPNLIFMIFIWSLANIFNFNALKITEASTFTVIFSSRAFFTTVASSIFLNEYLNPIQWLGSLLIFLGIIIVSVNKKGLRFGNKIYLSLLTAVCFGLALTNDRVLLQSFNLYPYVTLAFILPAFGVFLYKPGSYKNMPVFFKKDNFIKTLAVCSVFAITSLTFFQALKIAPNSSQVATVSISGVVVTVLLSIIFLNERDNIPKKLLGALLSFGGVYLVS